MALACPTSPRMLWQKSAASSYPREFRRAALECLLRADIAFVRRARSAFCSVAPEVFAMYTRFQIENRDQLVIMDAMFDDGACRS